MGEGFDKKAYQRRYMLDYMREKRALERARIGLPRPGEGKRRWEMRAEEMRAIAESMRSPEARAMMESIAKTYEQLTGSEQ